MQAEQSRKRARRRRRPDAAEESDDGTAKREGKRARHRCKMFERERKCRTIRIQVTPKANALEVVVAPTEDELTYATHRCREHTGHRMPTEVTVEEGATVSPRQAVKQCQKLVITRNGGIDNNLA